MTDNEETNMDIDQEKWSPHWHKMLERGPSPEEYPILLFTQKRYYCFSYDELMEAVNLTHFEDYWSSYWVSLSLIEKPI